jgi:hypothetical protein
MDDDDLAGRTSEGLRAWFRRGSVFGLVAPLALVFGACSTADGGGEGGTDYVPPGLGGAGLQNSKGETIHIGGPAGYPCTAKGEWGVTVYSLGSGTGTLDGRKLVFSIDGKRHVIVFEDDKTLTLDGDESAKFSHPLAEDFSTGSWKMVGRAGTLQLSSADQGNTTGSLTGTEAEDDTVSVSGSFDGADVELKISDSKGSHDWSGSFSGASEILLKSGGDSLTLRRENCPDA